MDKEKSLAVLEHASQGYTVAHRSTLLLHMTASILDEDPGVLDAVGRYLRTAAKSHPLKIQGEGHWHQQATKARIGAYSFMLTLEEGGRDNVNAQYLPHEYRHVHDPAGGDDTSNTKTIDVSEFAEWYWHLSMVQFHEDSGAQLPVPSDQARNLTEAILRQEIWSEWLHYAVNVGEPLVIHAFVPYKEEDG